MKKQFHILFFILFLSVLRVVAQRTPTSSELGLFIGASYYTGDLCPMGHFNQFTKPAGGIVYRYNFNPRLAFRGNFLVGTIAAYDEFSNVTAQQQRNLSFKSTIGELSAQIEFNFLQYEIGDGETPFSPYIFLGLAGFKFNPKAKLDDKWIALQPLGTEGQGLADGASKKLYKLTQISIPFGVGIKINLAKRLGASLEWGMRKTFTDYLDDVSSRYYDPAKLVANRGALSAILSDRSLGKDPSKSNVGRLRGNPTNNDWYSFAGVVLTVKLNGKRERCPGVGN
ncbi:MAG: DUF6089 family protein [Bacteroidia bacterium]